MLKERVQQDVEKAVAELGKDSRLVFIERPRESSHGDYATNVALRMGEPAFAHVLAQKLSDDFDAYNASEERGFVNVTVRLEVWHKELSRILEEKENYGALNIGNGEKVNVEFISANPTGPLTVGNARGGFVGDVLASVLEKTGYAVTREYYFNDAGTQVGKLVASVRAHAEGTVTDETQYKGEYIQELADEHKEILKSAGDDELGKLFTTGIFERYIRGAIGRMGIAFEVWSNERELIESGAVEKVFERLKEAGLLYEEEGALWVRTEELGDERNRVVRKSNGDITYLGTDIAYHIEIFKKRGFERAIKIWGADHAAQAPSLKALVQKLVPHAKLEFVIMQFVRLLKGGEEFKISKRAGTYVTVEELLDEIGLDAARWFMLSRATNTHIELDIDLAKEQSQKNPVYYVQYSYARANQIFEKVKEVGGSYSEDADVSALIAEEELELIKKLAEYPELLENIVARQGHDVHKLTTYAHDLATTFHKFYEQCFVVEEGVVNQPRLTLVRGYQIVLKDVLTLLGISAPEKM